MGNFPSKELSSSNQYWPIYFGEMGAVSLMYIGLYSYLVRRFMKNSKSVKDCLHLTTNIGSSLHSCLMMFFFAFFFIQKRWKNPIIDEPKMAGHGWCWWTSYMFVDLLLHIIFYTKYGRKEIPFRFDIILHHIAFMCPLFCIEYPHPIYGWAPLNLLIGGELSTIFLNAQWFCKYYKIENKNIKKWLQIGFLLSWFLVRLPGVVYGLWWLIYFWERIYKEMPMRVAIASTIFGGFGSLPQILWTILIILKVIKSISKAKNKEILPQIKDIHAHGVSIEYGASTELSVTDITNV